MNKAQRITQPSLASLAEEVRKVKERIEDLEDLVELRAAVARNAGKAAVPWEEIREELGHGHQA